MGLLPSLESLIKLVKYILDEKYVTTPLVIRSGINALQTRSIGLCVGGGKASKPPGYLVKNISGNTGR